MICRRVDLSRLRIAIALAREANQFAASSPHERMRYAGVGEMTKAPDVATSIRLRAHVRFTAKATELLRRREMTRCAKTGSRRSEAARRAHSSIPARR